MDTSGRARRRNRLWPEAVKREIVAASFAPGASVSTVARQYDVNANQVFAWRKLFDLRLNEQRPQLIPVMVTPDDPGPASATPAAPAIEIALPNGYCVRVGHGVEPKTLRLVLDALRQR